MTTAATVSAHALGDGIMQTEQEEHLRAFLRSWLDWAEGGAADYAVFDSTQGLCGNLVLFLRERITYTDAGLSTYDVYEERNKVRRILHERLERIYVDDEYPFGMHQYSHDARHGTHHELPARLVFVREWLAELEEACTTI